MITHTDNLLIIFFPGSEDVQTAFWKKSFKHIKTQHIENSEEMEHNFLMTPFKQRFFFSVFL